MIGLGTGPEPRRACVSLCVPTTGQIIHWFLYSHSWLHRSVRSIVMFPEVKGLIGSGGKQEEGWRRRSSQRSGANQEFNVHSQGNYLSWCESKNDQALVNNAKLIFVKKQTNNWDKLSNLIYIFQHLTIFTVWLYSCHLKAWPQAIGIFHFFLFVQNNK